MREIATKERTLALLKHLGNHAKGPGRVYLTGGSTAVLIGWRKNTMDVDLINKPRLLELFLEIEPNLIRYPNLKPAAFRSKIEAFCSEKS